MKDCFHGWRRKIGLVTLLLAVGFMAFSLRSTVFWHRLYFRNVYSLSSRNGALFWGREFATDPKFPVPVAEYSVHCRSVEPIPGSVPIEDLPDNVPYFRCLGFGSGEYGVVHLGFEEHDYRDLFRVYYWRIPHWSLFIPLTLISAILLVSNSDKASQKKMVDTRTKTAV